MTGIKISVRNVAKLNPKIIVHDNGPKNITLSPPKCRCGFKSLSSVAKLIFIPIANGISPRIVAVAVRTTGVIRVIPA